MWALGLILIIALVVAFLVLDGRSGAVRASAEPTAGPEPEEAAHDEPADVEPVVHPEDVERAVYRELYSDRSGEVSRRRAAAG